MTSIEKLVQQFAESTAAQTDIMLKDPKKGNKYAKQRARAFELLRSLGNEGRDALVPLMHEGRDDVREMAAVYLLRHRHDEARQVLEDLAQGKGLVAFGANQALKRWEEGTWQLDPP